MKYEHRRWKVCFGKNFWGAQKGNDPGEELRIDRGFTWGGRGWRIPAIYQCRQGYVVDFVIEVPGEEFTAFLDRWGMDLNGHCDRELTRAEQRQIEQENPLSFDFRALLELNGMRLRSQGGCGTAYLPGEEGELERSLVRHYGLDETKIWRFWRESFPWATQSRKSRPKRVRELDLHLEADAVELPMGTFPTPEVGASVTLDAPDKTAKYILSVTDLARETVDLPFRDGWELPNCFLQMTYTLTPDAGDDTLRIYDSGDGDHPRRKPRKLPPIDSEQAALMAKYGLEQPMDNAIAVIGGVDGPTAVFIAHGSGGDETHHTVCSGGYFEAASLEQVTWQAVSRQKPCEGTTVSLICNV